MAHALAIAASVHELSTMEGLDADITIEEVKPTIKTIKNDKSPGADGLPRKFSRWVMILPTLLPYIP